MATDKDKTTPYQLSGNATQVSSLDGTEFILVEQSSLNKVAKISDIVLYTNKINLLGEDFGTTGIKTDTISSSTTGIPVQFNSILSQSIGNGLSAAGTTQGTATKIIQQITNFTTVGSNTGAVLPVGSAGSIFIVMNNGANNLSLYPFSTNSFAGNSASSPNTLHIGDMQLIIQNTATTYIVMSIQNYNLIDLSNGSVKISENSSPIGFFGKTPANQPTTSIVGATFAANSSGITNGTATYGGYTMGQVVAALQLIGLLT